MSKHTPGPWRIDEDGVGIIFEIEGYAVATVAPKNRTANARILSAAPDMLVELEDMTNVAEQAIIASGTDAEFAAIRVERARAAIAKAKGRP